MKFFPTLLAAVIIAEAAAAGWELIVHNVAIEAAILGAGLVGLREIYRRAIKPIWWTIRKIDAVYDAVRDLPAWRADIDQRMAEGAEHFARLDSQLDLLARADRQRIADALAQAEPPTEP